MLTKNQLIEIEITDLTSEGNGVGHVGEEHFAVFVPNTTPGDRAEIKIVKVLKSYAFGRLEKLLVPSRDRIPSDCPVSHLCGGCSLRHISYEAECHIKNGWVEDCLKRLGDIHLPMEPFSPSPYCNRYRNKAQYPISQDADGIYHLGFYAKRSHRIIDADDCLLQPEVFSQIAASFRAFLNTYKIPAYNEITGKGLLRHLYLRQGEKTGEILFCLVANGSKLPHQQELIKMLTESFPKIVGIVLNVNQKKANTILGQKCITLWGKDTIRDVLCGVEVELSPLSFYQVNHDSAENLYGIAKEFAALTGNETLLDLFCGAGTIGLSMAESCKKLIGVEIIPQAVENAKQNAARSGIHNAEFFCADAGQAAARFAEDGVRPDVVVLDPPRKGCDQTVIDAVVTMSPSRVVMVSCNPATMARDCKLFEEQGYLVQRVKAVDMFPRTGHVETVILLSRKKPDAIIEIDLEMSELDLTRAESKATYKEIGEYVQDKYGLQVSRLYIAQVKREFGIIERINYNVGEGKSRVPKVTPEKREAIIDALKYFQMIE